MKDIHVDEASYAVSRLAAGIGILSGLAGTAVMTAAQMIEMKITGREASDAPIGL